MRNRVKFALALGLNFLLLWFIALDISEINAENPAFSFGVIADCQYSNEVGSGVRKYSLSEKKLQECVSHFNTMDLEFVIHLGDFIDLDYRSFDVVAPIYKRLQVPGHHLLGNHDFAVEDSLKVKVSQRLGMPSKYYDFEVNGWHFVVLDGNDISLHAYPEESKENADAKNYYERNNLDSPEWNGAVGEEQLVWIQSVLDKALESREKVILFCHFPVYPDNVHNLWNSAEVVELIENYPNVLVYMNGHNHAGNYAVKNGVHYLTFKGMVDTEQTSYAVINIFENTIQIVGYGREQSRVLSISE